MRSSWNPDALYLSVNHGPFAGFHTHNDLLDFELYAYGTPLAVDAGLGMTYDDPLYVPWYKSSRAHNMVVVNDSDMQREGVEGEHIRWGSLRSLDFFWATITDISASASSIAGRSSLSKTPTGLSWTIFPVPGQEIHFHGTSTPPVRSVPLDRGS